MSTSRDGSPDTLCIVGSGPGLSAAIARRWAPTGATLTLIARRPDRLSDLLERLRGDGAAGAHAVRGDAADPEDLRRALREARELGGEVTVLVYNAPVTVDGPASELPYEQLVEALRVGAAGALLAAQEVAPTMRAAGAGTLLLTGSGLAVRPWSGLAAASVAKAALRTIGLLLAAELAPAHVHATTITIRGTLGASDRLSPERVAEEFWRVRALPQPEWRGEVTYPPPDGD